MRCDEFQAAVLSGQEDSVTAEHEAACARCRSEASHMRSSASMISDPDVWEVPASDLRNRVIAAVVNEAGLRRRTEARSRRWLPAIAAAIVVIAGLAAFVGLRNPPDWEVAIDGTSIAPDAMGVVAGWSNPSGTRMVLDVTGLEPAPPGYVYEFWLSAGSRHISAGTFVETSDDLELWAGVSRREYPRLWVTLEPLDDDESLSGETVLDTGA